MEVDTGNLIEQVLQCIEFIELYTGGKSVSEFYGSVLLQDAVIRRIEVIAEAVKNIPHEIKDKSPAVPWKKIAAMREMLIDEYSGVNLKLTWEAVVKDMPELKKNMLKIRNDSKRESAREND
jgi:uncharacterized protein with HEPN domain